MTGRKIEDWFSYASTHYKHDTAFYIESFSITENFQHHSSELVLLKIKYNRKTSPKDSVHGN